jgi:hypothetical protein
MLDTIKSEYDLYKKSSTDYQSKVNSVSDLFSMKGKDRFKWNYCPVALSHSFGSIAID